MTNTLALWLLTSVALFTSTCALFVAFRTWVRCRSSRLFVLSTRLQELEEGHEAMLASLRGLKSRIGMAEVRARRKHADADEPVDAEENTGAEFRRKMNAAIAAGQVSAIPRR